MGLIDSMSKGFGDAFLGVGNWFMEAGTTFWRLCSKVTVTYLEKDPMTQTNAWEIVTGNIFGISLGVAGSLAMVFFLLGWVRESIDIRTTFTLDNIFKQFIRLALALALIGNTLTIVTGVTECATELVRLVDPVIEIEDTGAAFDELEKEMEDDDAGILVWMGMGISGMICGMIGCGVIISCGMSLVLAVMSRLFRMLLCIPFAPVALSGFAGGGGFSHMGVSWIKTFIGFGLEATTIALCIAISFGMFADARLFSDSNANGVVRLVLLTCDYCIPMLTAVACVKGAEHVVRRCFGF